MTLGDYKSINHYCRWLPDNTPVIESLAEESDGNRLRLKVASPFYDGKQDSDRWLGVCNIWFPRDTVLVEEEHGI